LSASPVAAEVTSIFKAETVSAARSLPRVRLRSKRLPVSVTVPVADMLVSLSRVKVMSDVPVGAKVIPPVSSKVAKGVPAS